MNLLLKLKSIPWCTWWSELQSKKKLKWSQTVDLFSFLTDFDQFQGIISFFDVADIVDCTVFMLYMLQERVQIFPSMQCGLLL